MSGFEVFGCSYSVVLEILRRKDILIDLILVGNFRLEP